MTTEDYMAQVVAQLGSKAELARYLECTRSFAGRIVEGAQLVPAKKCRDIEYLMRGKVRAEDLRPDVFKPTYRQLKRQGAV